MVKKVYVPNCNTRDVDALVKETFDAREGVVMDSYIAVTKDNVLIVAIDTFETSWTSGYTLYIATNKKDEARLWDIWQEFADRYDEEYGEEVE